MNFRFRSAQKQSDGSRPKGKTMAYYIKKTPNPVGKEEPKKTGNETKLPYKFIGYAIVLIVILIIFLLHG